VSIAETAKSLGIGVFGLVAFVLVATIMGLLLYGTVWVVDWIKPLFWVLTKIAIALQIIVLLPLSAFRRTRSFSVSGMGIASFVYLTLVFLASTVLAYQKFGLFGVVFGGLLGGVGIVPVGIVAAVMNDMWIDAADVVLVLAIWYGTILYVGWIEEK
jgi:hypothetical protein